MAVFSFMRHKRDRDERAFEAADWQQQNLAEIYRVQHLLMQNGVRVDLDRGLTDRGEPWCVFFDPVTQDVLIHIARLSGRYVLVSSALEIEASGRSFREVIDRFETALCNLLELNKRPSGDGKVVVHPASKLLFALAAVYLLVKSKAEAAINGAEKPLAEGDGETDNWLQDKVRALLARAQDVIDNPYVVAAMLGVFFVSAFSETLAPADNMTLADNASAADGDARIVASDERRSIDERALAAPDEVQQHTDMAAADAASAPEQNDEGSAPHTVIDVAAEAVVPSVEVAQIDMPQPAAAATEAEPAPQEQTTRTAQLDTDGQPTFGGASTAVESEAPSIDQDAWFVTFNATIGESIGSAAIAETLVSYASVNGADDPLVTAMLANSLSFVVLEEGGLSMPASEDGAVVVSDSAAFFSYTPSDATPQAASQAGTVDTALADAATLIGRVTDQFDDVQVALINGGIIIYDKAIVGMSGRDINVWAMESGDGALITVAGASDVVLDFFV